MTMDNEKETACKNPEGAALFGGCIGGHNDQIISATNFICEHEHCPLLARITKTVSFIIIENGGNHE